VVVLDQLQVLFLKISSIPIINLFQTSIYPKHQSSYNNMLHTCSIQIIGVIAPVHVKVLTYMDIQYLTNGAHDKKKNVEDK